MNDQHQGEATRIGIVPIHDGPQPVSDADVAAKAVAPFRIEEAVGNAEPAKEIAAEAEQPVGERRQAKRNG